MISNAVRDVMTNRDVLTPRQREVMELAARGLTNQGIADALHVSERTVRTHMASVFNICGVSNRVAALVALGYVHADAPPGRGELIALRNWFADGVEFINGLLQGKYAETRDTRPRRSNPLDPAGLGQNGLQAGRRHMADL